MLLLLLLLLSCLFSFGKCSIIIELAGSVVVLAGGAIVLLFFIFIIFVFFFLFLFFQTFLVTGNFSSGITHLLSDLELFFRFSCHNRIHICWIKMAFSSIFSISLTLFLWISTIVFHLLHLDLIFSLVRIRTNSNLNIVGIRIITIFSIRLRLAYMLICQFFSKTNLHLSHFCPTFETPLKWHFNKWLFRFDQIKKTKFLTSKKCLYCQIGHIFLI